MCPNMGSIGGDFRALSRRQLYSMINELRRENSRVKTDLARSNLLTHKCLKYVNCLQTNPKFIDYELRKEINTLNVINRKSCVVTLHAIDHGDHLGDDLDHFDAVKLIGNQTTGELNVMKSVGNQAISESNVKKLSHEELEDNTSDESRENTSDLTENYGSYVAQEVTPKRIRAKRVLDSDGTPVAIFGGQSTPKRQQTHYLSDITNDCGPTPDPRLLEPTSPAGQCRPIGPMTSTPAPPQRSRSARTGGHLYQCPIDDCVRGYRSLNELSGHQLRAHPDSYPYIPWRVCQRTACGYKTKCAGDFKRHGVGHTANEAPVVEGVSPETAHNGSADEYIVATDGPIEVQVAADTGYRCQMLGCHTVCATVGQMVDHVTVHHCTETN